MRQPPRAEAEDARERFLALVSHELRSPLNGIKSWAHVLERCVRDAGDDPHAARAVEGILFGVDQELVLIEDLIEAARVLGGTVRLSRQPVQFDAVLADAIACCEPAARAKEVRIVRPRPAHAVVDGDFARLQRLVARLLEHSIHFSPSGSRVELDAGCDDGHAWVMIADEGPSIPSSAIARLLDPFAAVDEGHSRRAHMLGLALPVANRVAELHGGVLECTSDAAARRTTFRLALPVLATAPA